MKERRAIEICTKALNRYGIDSQTRMLGEETGELFKACNKLLRWEDNIYEHHNDQDNKYQAELQENIADEMADVLITMVQMQLHWHITEDMLQKHYDYKLNRLEMRVNLDSRGYDLE